MSEYRCTECDSTYPTSTDAARCHPGIGGVVEEKREGSDADLERWAKWDDLRARKDAATTDEEREALAKEEEALRQAGVAELLIEDFQTPKSWVWLSFVDPKRKEGKQFLGVAIVEAGGIMEASMVARMNDCNPGGEVKGVVIPPEHVPAEEFRYRLLSKAELEENGLA